LAWRSLLLTTRALETELPFAGFASASGLLDEGCRRVRSEIAFVRSVAALMLAAYVQLLAPASFATLVN